MSLLEIATGLSATDGRNPTYLYHAAIVAARALGIFNRGRIYDSAEVREIKRAILQLFPGRS